MSETLGFAARCLGAALVACVLAAVPDASAQSRVYRCATPEGRAFLSDRPCQGAPSATLGTVGPVASRRLPGPAYRAPPRKAAAYLQYMSSECAELAEGIRNGPSRGLGYAAQNELQTNYRAKCSEDERRALMRLAEEERRAKDARSADERDAKAEREREALSREQCDEMYRILHRKRETLAAMTSGERADFYRFEANWKARCHTP